MADAEGIRIFTADIIYHLEEAFRAHMEVRRGGGLGGDGWQVGMFVCLARFASYGEGTVKKVQTEA